jgi:hypothetical protein
MSMRFLIYAFLVFVAGTYPSHSAARCPYLKEFKNAVSVSARLPAGKAASVLEAYAGMHENPEACESVEIDRRLGLIEPQLFALSYGDKHLAAQFVSRCNEFDSATAQCRSPMEDGTAHPVELGIKPRAQRPSGTVRIMTARSGASTLRAVYVVKLSDAIEGRAATRIQHQGDEWRLPPDLKNFALIAVFKTDGVWRYRKAVWYF